ncbi:MAG: hypothetical protein LBC48_01215, partial [Dysgonamonadaceae bacterium]|nr:hypothetical protein [Dysgonamonadaceae bacterium]
ANDGLLEFHHLDKNYFDDNSYFEYESDFIKIKYSGKELTEEINVKEGKILDYQKTKNIYIPAERNFVSANSNLERYNNGKFDNILGFIYDWFPAKRRIDIQNSFPILNFDINYYYKEGIDVDMLFLNKEKKPIPLKTGSSGLQSVIPLLVIFEYLIKNIYDDKPSVSVIEFEHTKSLIENLIFNYSNAGLEILQNKTKTLNNNRTFDNFSQFIIEEPEQNLFPSTQRDLIYHLLKNLQSDRREHTLTITTHSPYILYALNNCMLGGLVYSQLEGSEKEDYLNNEFASKNSRIDPRFVSVWEIEDGKIRSIQDKDGIISKNYFDQKMTELMDEYYLTLNYYKDEDER